MIKGAREDVERMWEGKRRDLIEILYIYDGFFSVFFWFKGGLFMKTRERVAMRELKKRDRETIRGEDERARERGQRE
jgi:hypothetical protein